MDKMTEKVKERKRMPRWTLLALQLLLTGAVLCGFAVFHHVIPRMRLRAQESIEPIGVVERSETPTPEPTAAEEIVEATPEPWSVRFAEHFSEETVQDDNGYRSPNVSVSITKYSHPDDFPTLTYFVADIYVTDVSFLKTGVPVKSTFASGEWIAESNGAILAVNGDGMLTSHEGFVIRNGAIYKDSWSSLDLCALYYDGTMETFGPEEYSKEEILIKEPYQLWQFGPMLLDADGQPLEELNVRRELRGVHPRTAIGYYEPGHYCLVVVDGRQGHYSAGADIDMLARLMSSLGCRSAYNFDGGASSMMVYAGETISKPCSKRYISDMLIVTDVPAGEEERP